eukprot:scaffold50372_cov87-Phaeocystis_antarctica.AAC.1
MQADSTTLQQQLQESRAGRRASRTCVYGPGRAGELRSSAAWAAVTALVDSAHCTTRGAAHGGSGVRAEDVMPQGESEGRTVYVLAYAQAEPRRPSPGAGPSPGTIAVEERELEIERELEMEMEMGTDDGSEGPQPGPEDLAAAGPSADEAELEAAMQAAEQGGAQARPGSPDGSSPSSTPPTSPPALRSTSRAASPAIPRPASPTAARWEKLVRTDRTEGDEDELVEAMAARLLKAHEKDEARREL